MQDMCDQRGITTVDVDLRLQGPVPYGMVLGRALPCLSSIRSDFNVKLQREEPSPCLERSGWPSQKSTSH